MQRVKKQAEQYLDKQRRTKRWHKVVTALAGIVVFCTTYALILPAVTMTTPLQCGTEEHTHTDECYITELVTPEPRLVCELEETEPHTHDESCYEVSTVVACGLEECEPHTHDESCCVDGELACGLEETEGHVHTNDCLENEFTLICGKEETEGHTHTDECFVTDEPQEQRTLTCEKVEHTHDDNCYLALELEPAVKYYCGFDTEHTHDESCYFENGELKCNIPEHTHTDECTVEPLLPVEPIALDDSFSAESDDGAVIVEIHVTGEAALPDGAQISEGALPQLTVTASEDDEAYDEYAAIAAEEGEVMMVAALDYKLTLDGYELDLSACEVTVSVTPTEAFQAILDAPQEAGLMMVTADAAADADTTDDTIESDEDAVVERYNFSYYTVAANGVGYAVTRGANPSFTVQYYAYLERAVKTDTNKTQFANDDAIKDYVRKDLLPLIDTDGGADPKADPRSANYPRGTSGKLPKNGTKSNSPTDNTLSYLTVENEKIVTKTQLTEIYKAEDFTYQQAPGLKYFNIVLKNKKSQYELSKIWVLNEGGDPTSTTENDGNWTVYDYNQELTRFTNRRETADADKSFIYIDDGAVIRLVYNTKKVDENLPANFYDYNTSDGRLYRYSSLSGSYCLGSDLFDKANNLGLYAGWNDLYMKTNKQGINRDISNNGESGSQLAFGNGNTNSGWGTTTWEKDGTNQLNKYNSNSFRGCTFSLVQGAEAIKDSAGNVKEYRIKYSGGVVAPKLFNEGTIDNSYDKNQLPKKAYDGYSLDFERKGDTYTLSAVKKSDGTAAVSDLTKFKHPKFGNNNPYGHIMTNSFWPLDNIEGYVGMDSQFGVYEFKHNDKKQLIKYKDGSNTPTMPDSDDGQFHNSYFGMQFAVTFELTKNYVGPLEYYFFGDDDMWVFLDDKLVCDIGGVHSSVGEYVNLWDYINKGALEDLKDDETKTYTLTFYYTERGASGSTCWMQFTLPTVVGLNLEKELEEEVNENNGSLWIQKEVSGIDSNDWFEFKLKLDGVNAYDNFVIQGANGEIITEGDGVKAYISANDTFRLQAGAALVIQKLPKDTTYTITEVNNQGYHTESATWLYSKEKEALANKTELEKTVTQGSVAEGPITVNDITKVVFTNTSSYELPATGGSGTAPWYTMGGVLLIAAVYLMYKKRQWLFGEGDSV